MSDWTRMPLELEFDPGPWSRITSDSWEPEFYLQGWERRLAGQTVILSQSRHRDGRRWVHLSMSTLTRPPTWKELVAAKEVFLGKETRAIQVCPPRSEYVNHHPFVLHLFSCLDGDGLPPDFREEETDGSLSL